MNIEEGKSYITDAGWNTGPIRYVEDSRFQQGKKDFDQCWYSESLDWYFTRSGGAHKQDYKNPSYPGVIIKEVAS